MTIPEHPVSPEPRSPLLARRINGVAVLLVLADLLAIGITLFMLLRFIPPPRPFLVDRYLNFLDLILLPALPVAALLAIKRLWRHAAFWLIPALGVVILFGGLFLPRIGAKPTAGRPIRVMAYNLYGVKLLPTGEFTGKRHGARQSEIDIIRASGADVVSLEELSQDAVDAINEQLGDLYPYRILKPNGIAGMGMLSKLPIGDEAVAPLSAGGFPGIRGQVEFNGRRITVLCAHPAPPLDEEWAARAHREVVALAETARASKPVIVLGDFNMTDQHSDYRLLPRAGMRDAFREVGWGLGLTWPNRYYRRDVVPPLVRIDFIWHSDELEPLDCWVGKPGVSDHCPVLADLGLATTN